jgi:DNA-directed RNA polymerase specialized sigma24 family protein
LAKRKRQRVCITRPPEFFDRIVDPATEEPEGQVIPIAWLRVRRDVGRRPAPDRQVITWRYGLDGLTLTLTEAAERLGVSPATVMRWERRGLERLRTAGNSEPDLRRAA